jgi:Protein of unknown function, DUF547
MRSLITGLLALLIVGCATMTPPALTEPVPTLEPTAEWTRVLERFVDTQGRVDFAGLAHDRRDLDRYVAWVGANGPRTRPELYRTREQILAYHLNAYNALAMYNVIDDGIPITLSGLKKVSFFLLRTIRVDGTDTSLYTYENKVIRALGEERIHFALNCMSVGCPRLPREPFSPERMEAMLDRETRFFFGESRNLVIDDAARVVRVSEILKFFPEDFLAKAPSLLAYISRYAKAPANYTLEFIPYDWTVNRQPTR